MGNGTFTRYPHMGCVLKLQTPRDMHSIFLKVANEKLSAMREMNTD